MRRRKLTNLDHLTVAIAAALLLILTVSCGLLACASAPDRTLVEVDE